LSIRSELDQLRVVLVATRNPLNIGAAARAMSNFGVMHLRVVNPYSIAFREARSAVGAATLLANAEKYTSVSDAVADCALVVGTTAAARRDVQHQLRMLRDGAPIVRDHLRSSRVALVFGSEKRGLSNEDLSHCHWLVSIPTRDEHRSMNLGQAVAVCLYELIREDASNVHGSSGRYATASDLERITAGLIDALSASGYVNPAAHTSAQQKIRRLVRRLNIQAADGEILLGMLRQILWKLQSGHGE
jgi:TrmH family RNA methyltransferase